MDISIALWFRLFFYGLNPAQFYNNAIWMQDIPKKFSLGNTKLEFQKFGIEIILAKSFQYLFDLLSMLSQVTEVNQDVIKIYNTSNI